MIGEGTFREDLWYRLAEVVIKIPALAERDGDAVLLAHHFLSKYAHELKRPVKGFNPDALAAIESWPWPGNVRELENRMKRAVIMADTARLSAADLDLGEAGNEDFLNLRAARERADRSAIRMALARTESNVSNAAKLLGISRPTLYDLLKQYNIDT
jgi:two-component system NtrC family response regulator